MEEEMTAKQIREEKDSSRSLGNSRRSWGCAEKVKPVSTARKRVVRGSRLWSGAAVSKHREKT